MAPQNDGEAAVLTLENVVATSTTDILGASLRDLRKVLQDGPEPFFQNAEGARPEVLGAVLDLKTSLLITGQSKNDEDKENFEKLFEMSKEDCIHMAEHARTDLVRLMQSSLRHDDTINPRTFDATTAAGVLSVVLQWRLDATDKALQDSLIMNGNPNPSINPLSSPNTGNDTADAEQANDEINQPIPSASQTPDPFLEDENQTNTDLLSLLNRSIPKKRSHGMLTLKDVHGGKRVRFTTLGQMNMGNRAAGDGQDFCKRGSPADQLPPHLMGEYVGRYSTKLVLRFFDFNGGEILAGLLQEGTIIETAVRNRHWERSLSGEPYQAQQEAITLARIVHLTLMCFMTVEDALAMAPWLETSMTRLFANFYVEERAASAPGSTLWKIAAKILEVQAESTLQVPSMTRLMAQNATLYSKERNALVSLSKQKGQSPRIDNKKRKKDPSGDSI